jgi:hypothetical protein
MSNHNWTLETQLVHLHVQCPLKISADGCRHRLRYGCLPECPCASVSRDANGVCNRLLRFSVGIEHAEDLKRDVKQALQQVKEED